MRALLIAVLLLPLMAAAQTVSCRVVGVSDGDTLTCLAAGNQQIKVRLNQIDAPEKGQAFGQAAKRKLSSLVHGRQVQLRTEGLDKYGRTIAEVFSGSLNVNKEMVRSGYAWAYREYVRDNEYLRLEEQTRRASRGLWSEPNPIYPSEFRHGHRAGTVSQQILPPREPHRNNQGGFACNGKRFCREMSSCAEARFYLRQCGVGRLDRDGDGVPCESLCR